MRKIAHGCNWLGGLILEVTKITKNGKHGKSLQL